jgi:hypothetical protein
MQVARVGSGGEVTTDIRAERWHPTSFSTRFAHPASRNPRLMSSSSYALLFTVVPFLFGFAAVLAHRASGRRGLIISWAVATGLLIVLGVIDWRQPPDEGTPLIAYFGFAIIPTAAAAWAVERTGNMPVILRMLVCGTAGWLGILVLVGIFALVAGIRN